MPESNEMDFGFISPPTAAALTGNGQLTAIGVSGCKQGEQKNPHERIG